MNRKFVLSFICIFLLFQCYLIHTTAKQDPSSKVEIKSDSFNKWHDKVFDFSLVYIGEIINTNLIIQNNTNKILVGEISATIPFLLISPVNQFSIKAGEEIIFDLTLDVTDQIIKHYSGNRILIQTNYENIQIPVSFSVQSRISIIEMDIDAKEYRINGEKLPFLSMLRIINKRTLLDAGSLGEIFGIRGEFEQRKNSITYIFRNSEVELLHNNPIAKLNGKDLTLDVPATIRNGRFQIPLRFMAEKFLSAIVNWDPISHKILITYDLSKRNPNNQKVTMDHNNPKESKPEIQWDQEEIKLDKFSIFSSKDINLTYQLKSDLDFSYQIYTTAPWIKISNAQGKISDMKISFTILGRKLEPWQRNQSVISVTFPDYPELNKDFPITVDAIGNQMVIQITTGKTNLNENEAFILDPLPIIRKGRTFAGYSFMDVFGGCKIDWDNATKGVTISTRENSISFQIGDPEATVDGKNVEMDVPAFFLNGKSYFPVRFISENLGASVQYEPKTQMITITFPKK